jgi:hypothetical protein
MDKMDATSFVTVWHQQHHLAADTRARYVELS